REHRAQIVLGEICALTQSAKRRQPLPEGELAIAPVPERGTEISIFDQPFSSFADGAMRDLLPGHIEIKRANYVKPVGSLKEPEGCADTRIHIEHFVFAVALVVAVANIENAAIT